MVLRKYFWVLQRPLVTNNFTAGNSNCFRCGKNSSLIKILNRNRNEKET